jgi:hypothetical protein
MKRKGQLKELAKRLELTAYIPPQSAVALAEERTGEMVQYFLVYIRDCGWLEANFRLQLLANSCYLQGVNDAAVAMALTERQAK